ncbi:hypothetical protein K4H28_14555 [Deefgea tanakiae]|uniref:Uncharacterized protein n=1 Tax=Deefgea tanakiae TaxID=2865840 RepID=A0ABX8Z518_9NEIS|nr:hypothetical protein [Deefgea tanakiae]QZA77485.1 hypothetical protein K4H28_14555 [Deefgea tanakiae]
MRISEDLEKMLSNSPLLTPELQKMQVQYQQMLDKGLIHKQVYDLPLVNVLGPTHQQQETHALFGR